MKKSKQIAVILIVLSMLLFSACGNSGPDGAANKFLKALKTNNTEAMEAVYFGEIEEDSLFSSAIDALCESESLNEMSDVLSDTLMDFDYEIIDVKESGNSAVVDVKIITKDWASVIRETATEYLPMAFQMVINGDSERKIEKEFKKILKEQKSEAEELQIPVQLQMILDGGTWKVDASQVTEELLEPIFGDLMESERYNDWSENE